MGRQTSDTASVFGCAAVLLGYPHEGFAEDLTAVGAAIDAMGRCRARAHLSAAHGWLVKLELCEAQRSYVDTFDLSRRRTLYLTYYSHGDTRERGLALADLVDEYRSAGVTPVPGELPDFLPMILELASVSDAGTDILRRYRFALDALAESIARSEKPYVHAVRAVTEALGTRTRIDLEALRRFRSAGPPSESVGLEPFAPPEYVGMIPVGESTGLGAMRRGVEVSIRRRANA